MTGQPFFIENAAAFSERRTMKQDYLLASDTSSRSNRVNFVFFVVYCIIFSEVCIVREKNAINRIAAPVGVQAIRITNCRWP